MRLLRFGGLNSGLCSSKAASCALAVTFSRGSWETRLCIYVVLVLARQVPHIHIIYIYIKYIYIHFLRATFRLARFRPGLGLDCVHLTPVGWQFHDIFRAEHSATQNILVCTP